MSNKKPGFMIYSDDWNAALETFTDSELGTVLRALLQYDREGRLTEFPDRAISLFFKQALAAYIRDSGKYSDICEKRKQAALDRWGNTNASKSKQEDANASKSTDSMQTMPTQSNPTQPNPTQSNPTQPNPTQSNNKGGGEETEDKRKRFTPPSIEEIRAYIKERGSSVDPKQFFDFYSAGNWTDSKGNPVRNWKQKLLTWEQHQPAKEQTRDIRDSSRYEGDEDSL